MSQEDAMNMSNEQAIQILKPFRDMMIDQHGCPISDAVFALDKAIEALSVQPEQQWIPCKTALPEKGQYVLCQCRAGIMDVLHLTDDNGWYKDSTHIYMHGFVLAWMPLPEPYREEGTE